MKWEGDKLMVGGRRVAVIWEHSDTGDWCADHFLSVFERWYIDAEVSSHTAHPTREAAMRAAESAVREWLGKAAAEVMEPVAYGMPVSNAPPYDQLLAVEVRKPAHPGGARWVPLFILPEGAR